MNVTAETAITTVQRAASYMIFSCTHQDSSSITPIKSTSRTSTTATIKMGQDAPVTAYPATSIEAQNQEGGPGLDAATKQKAEWSRLEFWDDNQKPYLKEYEGRGLLQGKAALITGGDSGIGNNNCSSK
jgi:hypothetical protein